MSEFDKLRGQFPEIVVVRGCYRRPEIVLSHDIGEVRKETIKKALKKTKDYWLVEETKFIVGK